MSDFLFSFEGRSGRVAYLMFWFVWFILGAAMTTAAFLMAALPFLLPFLGLALMIAIPVSSLAIQARRLHDMGISAYSLFLIIPVYFYAPMLPALIMLGLAPKDFMTSSMGLMLAIGSYLFGVTYSFLLLLWPGDDGNNRFD